MKFNNPKSEETYLNEKYSNWFKSGFQSPQDRDPSFIKCSLCGKRTHNLKVFTSNNTDFLTCKDHSVYKGE